MLCDRLRIVDLDQHGVGSNVLTALDRNLGNAPVDPRRDVEPRRIHFPLHQQRLRPHQVPDRQADNGDDDQADDERWKAAGRRRPLGRVAQLSARIVATGLRCIGTGLGHLAARGATDWRLGIRHRQIHCRLPKVVRASRYLH